MNQQKPKKKQNKNGDNETVRGNLLCDLPEWSQEFTENLVDERVPAHRDAPASSSREPPVEISEKSGIGQAQYFSLPEGPKLRHLHEDNKGPFAENALATDIPRAEIFGDLITADHKVLSEGCESRNNHRYAVVVQDFGNPVVTILPVQNKNF